MHPPPHLQCTIQAIDNFLIHNYASKCDYVRQACSSESSIIDFLRLYYCTLSENTIPFLLLAVMSIFIAFYCISSIAEDYLEPALSKIAKKLNFSESLAGVTLVSLANGAPDVFAAFAAGGLKNEGLLVSMGGLFGGGIFTSSVVLAACIFCSKKVSIKAEPWALNRDCLFYLVSAIYLFLLGIYGKIDVAGIIGFFVIYLLFVGVLIYTESQIKKAERLKEAQQALHPEVETNILLTHEGEGEEDSPGLKGFVKHEYIKIEENETLTDSEVSKKKLEGLERSNSNHYYKKTKNIKKHSSHSSFMKLQWQYYTFKVKLRSELKEMKEKDLLNRFFSIVSIPFKLIGDLTIPASTSDQWNKTKAIAQPFTISLLFLWQFNCLNVLFNSTNLGIYVLLCGFASFYVWKTTCARKVPEGFMGLVFVIVSFFTASLWLNFVAHTIVDFINLVSIFTGLPLNYLGLTLLAWGNSLPDLYVDMALIKKGMDQTALSGIFGGQFFNFVIGFGISVVRQVWMYGSRPFRLLEGSQVAMINLVLIWWLVLMLAGTILYGNRNGYKLSRNFAVYLLTLYAWFFIFVTSMSL